MSTNYTPQTWIDFNPSYPLSATRMGHIESGIAAVDDAAHAADVLGWAYAGAFVLSTCGRDSNDAITTATVHWPDGTVGTLTTDTASSAFPGAIDAYHVTYGSPPIYTFTQGLVTRDIHGGITAQPGLVVT